MPSWFVSRFHKPKTCLCITKKLICAPIIIIKLNPPDKWRWSMQIWWMEHFNLNVSFISQAQIEIFEKFTRGKKKLSRQKYFIWHFFESSHLGGKRAAQFGSVNNFTSSSDSIQVLVKIIFTFACPTFNRTVADFITRNSSFPF